jgi:hypothetical protein
MLKKERFQVIMKERAENASSLILLYVSPREANARSAEDTGYYEREAHPPPPLQCLLGVAEMQRRRSSGFIFSLNKVLPGTGWLSSLEILNNQWHFSVGRGQVPPGASLGGNNGKKILILKPPRKQYYRTGANRRPLLAIMTSLWVSSSKLRYRFCHL